MTTIETDTLRVARGLPALLIPRLQLRWAAECPDDLGYGGYRWACHYELVLPLREFDMRREVYDDEGNRTGTVTELVVALKPPTMRESDSTPTVARDGSRYFDAPYRDGAHAQWDAAALGGLPIYVIGIDGMAFQRKEK